MEYVTERFIQQVCAEFEMPKVDIFQSHALVQVQAKEYLREMQLQLIVQPIVERLLNRFGSASAIETRSQQLLMQQQEKLKL